MISIVLPTYNEAEYIEELITQIDLYVKEEKEIIVVDDDSPDKTWKIVAQMAQKNSSVKLHRRCEKGLATAMIKGISEATGNIVVWLDSDGSHPPQDIPRLIDKMKEIDVDIVIASRFVPGGKSQMSFLRSFCSKGISLLCQILLSSKIKDWTSGFVAVKKEVIDKVPVRKLGHGYGEYFIDFICNANLAKFKICEIPYTNTLRQKGTTKTSPNLLQFWRYGFSYAKTIWKIWFFAKK